MTNSNDDRLWQIARRRADFRKTLYSYLVVNFFLWVIWWITVGRVTGFTGYPWPVWVMLGWGISLAMQYYKAYHGDDRDLTNEK